ncbi:MAG: arginine repressor [Candidatus Xenobia bacterium]
MTPRQRARAILALIAEQAVETQQDLVAGLEERGVEVTQATISRDIKRLGLFKRPTPEGGYRYAAPEQPKTSPQLVEGFVAGVEPAAAMLVVKTRVGRASAVAIAMDENPPAGVVGTLAGDDTVLVLLASPHDQERVRREIERTYL